MFLTDIEHFILESFLTFAGSTYMVKPEEYDISLDNVSCYQVRIADCSIEKQSGGSTLVTLTLSFLVKTIVSDEDIEEHNRMIDTCVSYLQSAIRSDELGCFTVTSESVIRKMGRHDADPEIPVYWAEVYADLAIRQ